MWRDGDATVGELAGEPAGRATRAGALVAAPRLVELCFQTAGVAQLATDGDARPAAAGAPAGGSAGGGGGGSARWAVTTAGEGGGVDAVVVDGEGRVLVRLSGYETVALPGTAAPADVLAPLEAALR